MSYLHTQKYDKQATFLSADTMVWADCDKMAREQSLTTIILETKKKLSGYNLKSIRYILISVWYR